MKQSQYNLMFLIFFFVTSLCLWKVDNGVQQALNEVDMLIPFEILEEDNRVLKQINPKPHLINRTLDLSHEERNCLSLNVYWEARNQDTPGQIAVAFVTINRKLNKYFKNDVCEVVKQGYRKTHGSCAFSWFCDGLPDRPKAAFNSPPTELIINFNCFGRGCIVFCTKINATKSLHASSVTGPMNKNISWSSGVRFGFVGFVSLANLNSRVEYVISNFSYPFHMFRPPRLFNIISMIMSWLILIYFRLTIIVFYCPF
jgi:hypothetical protein